MVKVMGKGKGDVLGVALENGKMHLWSYGWFALGGATYYSEIFFGNLEWTESEKRFLFCSQ